MFNTYKQLKKKTEKRYCISVIKEISNKIKINDTHQSDPKRYKQFSCRVLIETKFLVEILFRDGKIKAKSG